MASCSVTIQMIWYLTDERTSLLSMEYFATMILVWELKLLIFILEILQEMEDQGTDGKNLTVNQCEVDYWLYNKLMLSLHILLKFLSEK